MANQLFYAGFGSAVLQGQVNVLTGDIRVALFKSTYTMDPDSHENLSDIISHEVVGSGYTTLGQSLAGKTLTADAASNEMRFNANDVTWAASTITARYAVIYLYSGDPATSPLLWLVDFGSDQTSGAGDFTLQWATEGVSYVKGV